MILMKLTREQETVLAHVCELAKRTVTVPVTIGALHGTFSDMNVSDLVKHLVVLLEEGLIKNAGRSREKISNTYVLTPEGLRYLDREPGK
jgi:hypothetical protein